MSAATSLGIASKTTEKQPAASSATAPSAIAAAAPAFRPWAL